MRHPEFPVISFLAVPLLLSSLFSHIRARSVSTIALLAWLVVLNIIRGVNSLIWADNAVVRLEVWCDITTKVVIGFTFAVPLSALCICRHLEHISANRQAVITYDDRRRRMKFEAVMCFGLPMVFMALHYVVQGHRFDLIEDFGCYPSTYFSIPAVLIVWVPPLVISLISLVYAAAAFHHFLRRRIEFAAILRSSNSSISPGRYIRLMALAVFEILWDSGTNIYILYYNTFTGLRPWISWQNVHSNFSRVGVFPRFLSPSWALNQLIWQWWIIPISSISFFIFFGFGEEALSDYRAAIQWLRCTILRQRISKTSKTPIIPTHCSLNADDTRVKLPAPLDASSEYERKAWDDLTFPIPPVLDALTLRAAPGSLKRDTISDVYSESQISTSSPPPPAPDFLSLANGSNSSSRTEIECTISTSTSYFIEPPTPSSTSSRSEDPMETTSPLHLPEAEAPHEDATVPFQINTAGRI